MNKDGRGWELSAGEFSLHQQEGPSTITDCPSLVLSHARRDSCSKSRQAEPEILGLGSHWRSATNTASTYPLPNGTDRNVGQQEAFCQGSLIASQQPREEPGGLGQHSMSRGDYAAWPSGFAEAVSNLPSDKVLGGKTEEVCFCSWPYNFWSLGRSPEEGNGNLLQHSCLENSRNREAWRTTVHGVAKSQTRRSTHLTSRLSQPPSI